MTPWNDLTGHVALVTGGNSGIGLGMARGLRRAGASVAIWGTNAANNAAAVASLEAEPSEEPVAAFRVDVGDENAVAAGVEQTLATFGQIDSCFANAGVAGHPAPIDTMTTAERIDYAKHVRARMWWHAATPVWHLARLNYADMCNHSHPLASDVADHIRDTIR